ncbi:hypothetical protein QUF76_15965, partial [Desulfobacterales bacterium HSG16]|nr:hypothetical protein [Desulfobacterales bacterium HSG16]
MKNKEESMHLSRIKVPDFRVLHNVDIKFEKEFTPSVFPLGSQNGGGKSTLLQLIFTLLHCSVVPERLHFLKNILVGFKAGNDRKVLAIIEIWDGEETYEIEFFACNDSYIKKLLDQNKPGAKSDSKDYKFSSLPKLESIERKIARSENDLSSLEKLDAEQDFLNEIEDAA